MGLESNPQWVVDLNRLWPLGTDQKRYGDDNIRNLKLVLQNSFGGFAAGVWVTGTDGGAANAYTVNPAVLPPALGNKMTVVFAPVATNTGASTLNYAGLGVKNLKSVSGADLVAGDLVLGSIYAAFYNGTEFRLLSITKNYVDQLAFNSALPAIPAGTTYRPLYAFGGAADFRTPPLVRIPRTSNTALDETVGGSLIDITSGTFTQTVAAVASLPTYWYCEVENSGTGTITLDPNGAETVDGLATRVIYPGERIRLYKDEAGTAFKVQVLKAFYMKLTSGITFVMPSGYTGNMVDVDLVGGAGGAGSGRKGAAGSLRQGGSPGGAPARFKGRLALAPGTSVAIAIGAAGASGAAQTVDNTDGNNGVAGGNTTFGTLATAYGGIGGIGGSNGNAYGLIGGSGILSAGQGGWLPVNNYRNGGGPHTASYFVAAIPPNASHEDGGAGAVNNMVGNAIYGGASSVSNDTAGGVAPGTAGSSIYGVAAGGWGGSVTAANAVVTAGTAGKTGGWGLTGAGPGTNGAASAGTDFDMGNPGGGGDATATAGVNGSNGGNGSFPGGPGGGGGACTNGAGNSGAGGTSQAGQAIIMGVL